MTEIVDSKSKIEDYKWMLRPCMIYYDEYSECKSWKGRFHQYFIYGESLDCSQWKKDYKNCKKWENYEDESAAVDLIDSEVKRKQIRLKAHYDNDIWTNRTKPPDDWNKPLPDHILERQATSLLSLENKDPSSVPKYSKFVTLTCSIM